MAGKKTSAFDGISDYFHLGTSTIRGGPTGGTFLSGVVKLRADPAEDLLSTAHAFLKAANRCLNGNKVEANTEILVVPGAVCGALSCELFLKYIVLRETGRLSKGHQLDELFLRCSDSSQSGLDEKYPGILAVLERNRNHFSDARYHHESELFSFRQQELLAVSEGLEAYVTARFKTAGA